MLLSRVLMIVLLFNFDAKDVNKNTEVDIFCSEYLVLLRTITISGIPDFLKCIN